MFYHILSTSRIEFVLQNFPFKLIRLNNSLLSLIKRSNKKVLLQINTTTHFLKVTMAKLFRANRSYNGLIDARTTNVIPLPQYYCHCPIYFDAVYTKRFERTISILIVVCKEKIYRPGTQARNLRNVNLGMV